MTRSPAELAGYHGQQLRWQPFTEPPLTGLEGAELSVPLDHAEPDGRTITLTVGRRRANRPDARRGVLLIGPGDDLGNRGLVLLGQLATMLPEPVLDHFDLVGFDHRFMGLSSPRQADLEAEERLWVFHHPRDFDHEVRFQARVAAKVAEHALDILPHATSRNIARDMDIIRGALGEERISYLGYSYGTYLGAVYTQMFGEHADRVVLDSMCSPDWVWRGLFTDFSPNGERALNRWASWAADQHDRYGLGATGPQVRATYDVLLDRAQVEPVGLGGFPLDRTLIRLIAVGMLNSELAYEHLGDIVRAAAHGGPLSPETMAYLAPMFGQPKEETGTIAQLAILAGDWAWPRDPEYYERDMRLHAEKWPFAGAAMAGVKAPAFWPVLPREPVTALGAGNRAESMLLVAADQDMSTPLAAGRRMREVFAHNSRLVTVADTAHHRVFPFYGNTELNELVTAYLVDGHYPDTDPTVANPRRRL
ncbi:MULTISPECIES: alpha/beta fold hydrolase [Micromonospora]|uniref:TAP-like protein n=1 Tax=Micromonospora yangpuensis TaxID=683228 RepID=A0A1C6UU35_9ACTN|nr:alpha/beta fold hydrolase [Micromonospora yangpuensis]GGM24269.1 alpha/beta hydrolase [Micromonospora yangpuensis]SCL57594.1 TAP-like protein [Micromonospora yangpuensis]